MAHHSSFVFIVGWGNSYQHYFVALQLIIVFFFRKILNDASFFVIFSKKTAFEDAVECGCFKPKKITFIVALPSTHNIPSCPR